MSASVDLVIFQWCLKWEARGVMLAKSDRGTERIAVMIASLPHLLIASAVAALAQPALSEPVSVGLRVSGSGAWEIACTFETVDGTREERARGRGPGDIETLRAAGVTGGSCRYRLQERAQLVIRFYDGDGFACPFDAEAAIDDCQLSLAGEGEGGFELTPAP